jgi:hypothetical protein
MSNDEENIVQRLIEDQQKLLREMVEKEVFPSARLNPLFSQQWKT